MSNPSHQKRQKYAAHFLEIRRTVSFWWNAEIGRQSVHISSELVQLLPTVSISPSVRVGTILDMGSCHSANISTSAKLETRVAFFDRSRGGGSSLKPSSVDFSSKLKL